MTLALFSHCVMTASSPSGPKYTAKPTPISTFANEFTLAVLAADSEGKIDLTKTDPLIRSPSNPANPSSLDLLFTAYANVKPTVFALKNQKLSAGNDVLGFAAPEIETTGYGYRSFLFNPSGKIFAEAVNFTAVPTSDSYGRSFLRLGTDGGELKSCH